MENHVIGILYYLFYIHLFKEITNKTKGKHTLFVLKYTMNNNQGVFETLFHLINNLNFPLFWNTCY